MKTKSVHYAGHDNPIYPLMQNASQALENLQIRICISI